MLSDLIFSRIIGNNVADCTLGTTDAINVAISFEKPKYRDFSHGTATTFTFSSALNRIFSRYLVQSLV